MSSLFLLRLLAVSQVVFGGGALAGLLAAAVADPTLLRLPHVWLGIALFLLAIHAGVHLWRGTRRGIALSLLVQGLQVAVLIVDRFAFRFVAGPQWTVRFGAPRVWAPWGFEGSLVAFARPEFPPRWIGVNLVALAAAALLVAAWRRVPGPGR